MLSAVVPKHCQKQLTQTLVVCVCWKHTASHQALIVKSQLNGIELVTRPGGPLRFRNGHHHHHDYYGWRIFGHNNQYSQLDSSQATATPIFSRFGVTIVTFEPTFFFQKSFRNLIETGNTYSFIYSNSIYYLKMLCSNMTSTRF